MVSRARYLCLCLLVLLSLPVLAQTRVLPILDSVIERARQVSLYSRELNWDSLRLAVHQKAQGAKTIAELKPALETLLNGMRDMHGHILDSKTYASIARFNDYRVVRNPDTRPRDSEILRFINDSSLDFQSRMLPGHTGYLRIVGIGPQTDADTEARKIRNAITDLIRQGAVTWVIDLRFNGGGNMNPMVTGTGTLIGDGIAGSLVDLDNRKQFDWEIKQGNFIYGGSQALNLPEEPVLKKSPPIAVLLSRYTVSSGEILATVLKGRPDTRFFGEASGGYTTNNCWEVIEDKLIMAISTGIFADRNGTPYPYQLPVDEAADFILNQPLEKDMCIRQALDWLSGK